jgi:hypothetical protein
MPADDRLTNRNIAIWGTVILAVIIFACVYPNSVLFILLAAVVTVILGPPVLLMLAVAAAVLILIGIYILSLINLFRGSGQSDTDEESIEDDYFAEEKEEAGKRWEWSCECGRAFRFSGNVGERVVVPCIACGRRIQLKITSRGVNKDETRQRIFDKEPETENRYNNFNNEEEQEKQQQSKQAKVLNQYEAALKALGLSRNPTRIELKKAYAANAKKYHPDKVPPHLGDEFREAAEEKMKQINAAYSYLK